MNEIVVDIDSRIFDVFIYFFYLIQIVHLEFSFCGIDTLSGLLFIKLISRDRIDSMHFIFTGIGLALKWCVKLLVSVLLLVIKVSEQYLIGMLSISESLVILCLIIIWYCFDIKFSWFDTNLH